MFACVISCDAKLSDARPAFKLSAHDEVKHVQKSAKVRGRAMKITTVGRSSY
jgi:hypothetical protein